ncbi:unnamed protein product, partial [Prorocentrum cordatum]
VCAERYICSDWRDRGACFSVHPARQTAQIQNLSQKTESQRKQLSNKIRQALRIQRGCLALYEEAKKLADCHTVLEQPWSSRRWSRSPSIKKMGSEMSETIIHGCAYGLRDERTGPLIKKAWRVCSTDPEFGMKVGRACSNRPGRGDNHLHRAIEDGHLVAQTAYYPPAICKSWAKHIMKKNATVKYGKEIFAGLEQIPEEDDVNMLDDEEELPKDEDIEMETVETSSKGMGIKTELTKKGSGITSAKYHGQKGERSSNRTATEVERRIQLFKRLMTKLATLDPDCEIQEQRRLLARKSYLERECAERLRHAEQARNRVYQTWEAGDLVHFWREGKGRENRPGKKGGWHGPARVLILEKRHIDGRARTTSVVWIAHGNTLLRYAPEQLRPASEAEKRITDLQKQANLGKTMTEILETAKFGTYEVNYPKILLYLTTGTRMSPAAQHNQLPLNLLVLLRNLEPPQDRHHQEKRQKGNDGTDDKDVLVNLLHDDLEITLGADEHQTVYFECVRNNTRRETADRDLTSHILISFVANQRRKDKVELTWSKMNATEHKEFEEGIAKETNNWVQHQGLRPVPASQVKDTADIIRARWLFTRKADGRAKARLVFLGYQTKDLGTEPTASPTASRRARNAMLTIAAANHWKLIKVDVTSALPQANELEKDLFIEPDNVLKKAFNVKDG